MPSLPEGSTHGQTTSGMTCHHRLGKAHTFKQHPAWIEITALGLHARLEDVGRCMTSPLLDSTHGRQRHAWHDITAIRQHTWSDYVGRGMTSLLLDSTHGRMTSGVACHHRLWAAQTVERRQAWHAIIAFGHHSRSNDVGHGITSPPLGSTHGQTTSGVTSHHSLLTAHSVERRHVRHSIIVVGQHTWSNDVRRGMTSPHLDCTHGQTT